MEEKKVHPQRKSWLCLWSFSLLSQSRHNHDR